MPLHLFHPVVASWFERRFGAPTEAQRAGWPAIARGEDTLIAAPTGSGKTLAAFLWCLDRLLRRSEEGPLDDATEVVYVSPLKALSNDVEKNLRAPLGELEAEMAARLRGVPGIRALVRTGDTPQSERQKAARRPPHVLITTPESLYILLTAERSRAALATVKTVIVDEIHALAGTKRGAHLALTLERLEANARERPTRIGLSATQKPIEEVARFLVGSERIGAGERPHCTIIDVASAAGSDSAAATGRRKRMDLAVEIAAGHELSSVASHEQWDTIYDRVAALVKEHKATLVFCNTRRLVERAAHALGQRLGDENVAAHHGSLSKEKRFDAEQRLKENRVRVVVATASLELGIDVGAVDLVVQLGSPRSLSVLVQRVGRSGHWLGGTPKGRLFATTRDDLLECAGLVRAAHAGELDRVTVRRAPLDILAQQLVAEVAGHDSRSDAEGSHAAWDLDALFAMTRRAWPYARLERRAFDQVVEMLAHGVNSRRGRSTAFLHVDEVNRKVRARRGARLTAVTSGGAIPDVADYPVIADPEGIRVGSVDEDWAIESMRGDIFLLGNTSWRIRRVEAGTVRVEDAQGAPPTIPFWNGEAPGRSREASTAVSEVRRAIEERLLDEESAQRWLIDECHLSEEAAIQAVRYVRMGREALGVVPTGDTLVAERFFDEAGGMQLVIHAPYGSRINRAWGLALRKRFCRSFNFELQAAATDDGIVISLGPQHSFPLDSVFRFLTSATVEHVLTQALLGAPMFPTRWRWTVTRALAVLRMRGGKRVAPQLQRMKAEDLLATVFPDQAACPENLGGGDIELPDHPLVNETIRDCLDEPLDLDGVRDLIARIEQAPVVDVAEIPRSAAPLRLVARDVLAPSPFAEAILNANPYAFLDDAPLEERRTRAVMTRRQKAELPGADDLSALDPEAIARVVAEAWPPMRDADELHDALLSQVVLPEPPPSEHALWQRHAELVAARRATRLTVGESRFWVAAEKLRVAQAAYPEGVLAEALAVPPSIAPSLAEATVETARMAVVRAWSEVLGPVTAASLASRLALPVDDVTYALGQLEAEGTVLRGKFTPRLGELEFCDRRLLARIHRLTLGRLRREIAPVEPAELYRFLTRWQHVAPGTQLQGRGGLRRVLEQLEGYEIGAAAWERDVLPRRVGHFAPAMLDELCWRGEIAWGRLSPPSRPSGETARAPRSPTRAVPIALLARDGLAAWLDPPADGDSPELPSLLSPVAMQVLGHLASRGASFLHDLTRALKRVPSEIEAALGELVASGLVTGDSYAALRSLFGGGEASRERRPRRGPPAFVIEKYPSLAKRYGLPEPARRHSTGRWSLLRADEDPPSPEAVRELRARRILSRWGVVFRDLLLREPRARWSELAPIYRRMEARGELRGGRFVAGFVGEQYALPEAVEQLREVRRGEPRDELVVIAATDPLNLVGILTPGPRVPSVSGNLVLLQGGSPIASREAGEVVVRAELDVDARLRATRLLTPGARDLGSPAVSSASRPRS